LATWRCQAGSVDLKSGVAGRGYVACIARGSIRPCCGCGERVAQSAGLGDCSGTARGLRGEVALDHLEPVLRVALGGAQEAGAAAVPVGGDRGLGEKGVSSDGASGDVRDPVQGRDEDADLVGGLLPVVVGQDRFF